MNRSLTPNSTQSTAYTESSSSHTSSDIEHSQEQYKDYLEHDIKSTINISLDDFLKLFDNQDAAGCHQRYSELTETAKFKHLLEKYKQPVSHKTDRYDPFNDLANYILGELSGASGDAPIVVCRNDPNIVWGSSGEWKPDCVIVGKQEVEYKHQGTVYHLRENRPNIVPFHWAELLAFVEFSLGKRDFVTQTPPPSTNNTPTPSSTRPGSLPSSHAQDSESMNHQAPSSSVHDPSTNISSTPKKRKTGFVANSSAKRQKTTHSTNSARIRCASYALKMLSRGGFRSHIFGMCVTDDQFELLYYDRSLLLRSDPTSFTEKPTALVAVLDCMRRLNDQQWGHVIVPRSLLAYINEEGRKMGNVSKEEDGTLYVGDFNPLCEAKFTLNNGVTLKLGKVIYQQHGLISRGTCVVRAEVEGEPKGDAKSWKDKAIVVKLSFTPEDREPEGKKLMRIIKIARQNPNDLWVLDHLPEVLHYQEIPREEMKIQDVLSKKLGGKYEYRGLQVLVMTELFPITELTTTATLAPVVRDVFNCYEWVHETAGVIHRDISLNNIMYRKWADNRLKGVLSDFDLALWLAQSKNAGASSKQRTGTQPYMAIDLLENDPPPKHLYRHDLESIFYVILVLTTCYDRGEEVDNPPLSHWFESPMQWLAESKRAVLGKLLDNTTQFTGFIYWIFDLKNIFSTGLYLRDSHRYYERKKKFLTRLDSSGDHHNGGLLAGSSGSHEQVDDLTLGGHVTFEEFRQILNQKIEDF